MELTMLSKKIFIALPILFASTFATANTLQIFSHSFVRGGENFCKLHAPNEKTCIPVKNDSNENIFVTFKDLQPQNYKLVPEDNFTLHGPVPENQHFITIKSNDNKTVIFNDNAKNKLGVHCVDENGKQQCLAWE